jgi:hypothetical protein
MNEQRADSRALPGGHETCPASGSRSPWLPARCDRAAARQCGARPLGWPWTLPDRMAPGVRPLTASARVVLD